MARAQQRPRPGPGLSFAQGVCYTPFAKSAPIALGPIISLQHQKRNTQNN